jgi:hypothetical protein
VALISKIKSRVGRADLGQHLSQLTCICICAAHRYVVFGAFVSIKAIHEPPIDSTWCSLLSSRSWLLSSEQFLFASARCWVASCARQLSLIENDQVKKDDCSMYNEQSSKIIAGQVAPVGQSLLGHLGPEHSPKTQTPTLWRKFSDMRQLRSSRFSSACAGQRWQCVEA